MEKLLQKLRQDYPQFRFRKTDQAHWSPKDKEVGYNNTGQDSAAWTLLHELSHAILGHNSYQTDIELLRKEVAAWKQATVIGEDCDIVISPEHIENCLDTYRDWLHKRSTCPACQQHGIEATSGSYSCLNCQNVWQVSAERFCRPYRLKMALEK